MVGGIAEEEYCKNTVVFSCDLYKNSKRLSVHIVSCNNYVKDLILQLI